MLSSLDRSTMRDQRAAPVTRHVAIDKSSLLLYFHVT